MLRKGGSCHSAYLPSTTPSIGRLRNDRRGDAADVRALARPDGGPFCLLRLGAPGYPVTRNRPAKAQDCNAPIITDKCAYSRLIRLMCRVIDRGHDRRDELSGGG